jgi:probable selenium-dependent hydroxylase accessory protein YqeC
VDSPEKIGPSLREAFGIKPGTVVSLVGGGGKTTLMFALAREISDGGEKVITTTTTRIFEPAERETFLIVEEDEAKIETRLRKALARHRHVTLAAARLPGNKLKGIGPKLVDRIAALKLVPFIVNEADGSARKPLKAPNATEPVIPETTGVVIAVVGIDALGKPLNEENVFRAGIVSRLTGLQLGTPVTEEAVAELLTNPEGIIKGSPAGARIVPAINKVDLSPDKSAGESLAKKILALGRQRITRVVLGQFEQPEPVAKIIGN